jgi:cobalt-zinc-cadmium efflux system membrane fusion protein
MTTMSLRAPTGFGRKGLLIVALFGLAAGALLLAWAIGWNKKDLKEAPETARNVARSSRGFMPTPEQWAVFTVVPVQQRVFRPEQNTEGKIAVDEDRSTPIFSPYAGRVTKLLVKPGDAVERGQPLFVIEATDMVQAQNDFMAALAAMNKARSQVSLTQTVERRLHDLYDAKAMSLREWQQAQADLTAAQNDLRSAETGLEATRNRLRILGKTEAEITTFQQTGRITPDTSISAPIGGTIVQRKVGPGQYVGSGSADPVFVIGDLSTVWLVAYMRETDAAAVQVGQALSFKVLAFPDRLFPANISYVATALDPSMRRLLVRATVGNSEGLLKPEMFASVTILTDEGDNALAIPRDAIIYEGSTARVWVARDDKSVETREVKTGLISGNMVQIVDGLRASEKVITKGSIFIDRIAAGS